jgi:peptidoglycan hydrolase-like protein with peptidoglycan-binding domain
MMSDQQAKEIVEEVGESMGLAPIEQLAVRLVAKRETQYGAGWDAKNKPPREAFGAGSNNMGAVTTTSTLPGTFFVHGDSRFDPKTGKVVEYSAKFSRHATPQEGFAELARVLLFVPDGSRRRDNVAQALERRSLLELAAAMRANRYFLGVKPMQEAIEEYAEGLATRYEQIKSSTGEDYFDAPKAGPGSPEESGSEPESQSSQSARQYLQRLSASLPVLRHGARGDVVGVMQFEIGCEPDEFFGPKTEAALRLFQQAHGIETDIAPSGKPLPQGQCGVKTWAKIFDVPTRDESDGEAFDDANRVGGLESVERVADLRTAEQALELENLWGPGSGAAPDDDESSTA